MGCNLWVGEIKRGRLVGRGACWKTTKVYEIRGTEKGAKG